MTGIEKGARSTLDEVSHAPIGALQAVRDPKAQFKTAFEALRAILNEAAADLSDLVEITTCHVDTARHTAIFVEVKDRYLREPYPA